MFAPYFEFLSLPWEFGDQLEYIKLEIVLLLLKSEKFPVE